MKKHNWFKITTLKNIKIARPILILIGTILGLGGEHTINLTCLKNKSMLNI